jgi:hypothetical protein
VPALVAVVAESAVDACVAVAAVPAVVALGTVPSVDALICRPVSELAATFVPSTAPRAILDLVTAELLSCCLPTDPRGKLDAAYAAPLRETNNATYPTMLPAMWDRNLLAI